MFNTRFTRILKKPKGRKSPIRTGLRPIVLLLSYSSILLVFGVLTNLSSLGTEAKIVALVDYIDNYEQGLTAGAAVGDHFGFGNDLKDPGGFTLVTGEGRRNSTAARLSTREEGFRVGNAAIGYQKKFVLPIDASGCSALRYWLKNDTDNSSSDASVLVELIIGDGGDPDLSDDNKDFTGSTWVQTSPQLLRDLPNGSTNEFTSIDVLLQGEILGAPNGFRLTVAPSIFNSQIELDDSLLQDITAVNIVMLRNGEEGSKRSIYVDDVLFIRSSFSLTVDSTPLKNVPISGNFSGFTRFSQSSLSSGQLVSLTAPQNSSSGSVPFIFSHWIVDGIAEPLGALTVSFSMAQNSIATAVYNPIQHQLAVVSTPVPGFVINGDPATLDGTSNFVQILNKGSTVKLEAPTTQEIGGILYGFKSWECDCQESTVENSIEFVLDSDSTATAKYEPLQHQLTVQSNPSGVSIVGQPGGTTRHTNTLNKGATVSLTAPEIHTVGNLTYRFVQWISSNEGAQDPQKMTISFELNRDTTVTAIYDPGDTTLTVTSLPLSGVTITGSPESLGGTTDFTTVVDANTEINLAAPSSHNNSESTLAFKYWILLTESGTQERIAENPVSRTITEDSILVAMYSPIWILTPGWNLVSSPLELDTPEIKDLLTLNHPVWTWIKNRFDVAKSIQAGQAYFIYVETRTEIPLVGSEISDPMAKKVDLEKGWNLVGAKQYELIQDPLMSPAFRFDSSGESLKIIAPIWSQNHAMNPLFQINSETLPLHEQNVLFPGLGYWIFTIPLD